VLLLEDVMTQVQKTKTATPNKPKKTTKPSAPTQKKNKQPQEQTKKATQPAHATARMNQKANNENKKKKEPTTPKGNDSAAASNVNTKTEKTPAPTKGKGKKAKKQTKGGKHKGKGKTGTKQTNKAKFSTCVSDAVLCAASVFSATSIVGFTSPLRTYASVAFSLIGLAAFMGVLRFAHLPYTVRPHTFLSDLAAFVSTPLLGLCALLSTSSVVALLAEPGLDVIGLQESVLMKACVLSALAYLVLCWFHRLQKLYSLVMGGVGMVSIIYVSAMMINTQGVSYAPVLAIAGAAIYILSGIVIGTKGTMAGFQRVDIFHYALAVANLCIAFSFTTLF
jgi:hypothetical protein